MVEVTIILGWDDESSPVIIRAFTNAEKGKALYDVLIKHQCNKPGPFILYKNPSEYHADMDAWMGQSPLVELGLSCDSYYENYHIETIQAIGQA